MAHEFVLDWSCVRHERTCPVAGNPLISYNFIHRDAQLWVGFDQLMNELSTFCKTRQTRACQDKRAGNGVIFVTKIKTTTKIIGLRFQKTRINIIAIQKCNTK